MTHEELIMDLEEKRERESKDKELELERLKTCYLYASADDRRVVWAVLNKYVPMLTAEGVI